MDERDETKMPDGTDIMQVWFECNRDVFTFYDRIMQAALRTTPDRECEWRCDDPDNGTWESSCGETWGFVDGGPAENRMMFCHRCGGKLKTAPTPAQLAALDRLADNERELGLDYMTAPASEGEQK